MKALTEGTFYHIKKYFQVLKEYIVIWFHSGLCYWAIPKSLSKCQWLAKNGQIWKQSDYSLDMLFVNTYNMLFLPRVPCHRVRLAPNIVYDKVSAM